MHIAEGIITGTSAVLYTAAGIALVGYGTGGMKKFVVAHPEKRPLLGMAGALIFFISLLPIPAFTGTCSHPCGTPLIAILFGPAIGIALAGGSLLLQAAFFAHGGFGSWGANVVSLGLFGSLSGWAVYSLARKIGLPLWAAGFAGGLIGDVMVYVCSGVILARELANAPTPQYSFAGYLIVIFAAYLPTQLPIAIAEMVITGLALEYIYRQRPEVLVDLGLLKCIPSRCGKPADLALWSILFAALLVPSAVNYSFAAEQQAVPAITDNIPPNSVDSRPKSFKGMDDAVNVKLARDAGLPSRAPFIDIQAMGDLWNALLLIAGGICGFILGRWWYLIGNKRTMPENQKKCVKYAE